MDRSMAPLSLAQDEDQLAQPLPSETNDAQIAMKYMQSKRLQIIAVIGRAFFVLLSIFLLCYLVLVVWRLPHAQQSVGWLTAGLLLVCDGAFFAVAALAARKHLQAATVCLLLGVDITGIGFLYFWSSAWGHQADSFAYVQFFSLIVAIMLAGLFGNARLAFVTTVLMNIVTIVFGLAYASSELGLFLSTGILEEWAVFTISGLMASSYQQALREVSLAYAHTRQLEELKERFITNVHHELRTPVMTVLGYLDYLQRAWTTLSPEQVTRSFQKARDVGDHLMQLIQSILDVRRIDDHRIDRPEPVAVRAVCDTALQLVDSREAKLADRQVTFDIADDLAVWGEPVRLQQIMTNLLSNAGKYSPPGTPIAVGAAVVQKPTSGNESKRGQGTKARSLVDITVRDYGWGIPPDQVDLLFNRFVRLPRDLASTTAGNGLGLYLCRALATAMGGTIWVESTGVSGEGSTFHIQLPWCPTPVTRQPVKHS
ncbi:MAG TPA: HAMP domain-containing sensor histidine kinase [Ktedonobacterales bacterium]|nr:HAMP domain-containing sensor histidine kinase [Ktedonobacterales bacterium]